MFTGGEVPSHFAEAELPTLRAAVLESLRLLPPNAVMVRLTSRDGEILGRAVPRGCEVILSPYVAHRDAREWKDPDRFEPSRWKGLNPSPYVYLPFGAGSRYCLGKHLVRFILISMLARILREYDIPLAVQPPIDWKIHINLMPQEDPIVRFIPLASPTDWQSGNLDGPILDLIQGGYRTGRTDSPGRVGNFAGSL